MKQICPLCKSSIIGKKLFTPTPNMYIKNPISYNEMILKNFNHHIEKENNSDVNYHFLCSICEYTMSSQTLLPFLQFLYQANYLNQEHRNTFVVNDNLPLHIYPKETIKYIVLLFFTQYFQIFEKHPQHKRLIQYLFDDSGDRRLPSEFKLYINLTMNTYQPLSIDNITHSKSVYLHHTFSPISVFFFIGENIPILDNKYFNINHWDNYPYQSFEDINLKINSIV